MGTGANGQDGMTRDSDSENAIVLRLPMVETAAKELEQIVCISKGSHLGGGGIFPAFKNKSVFEQA